MIREACAADAAAIAEIYNHYIRETVVTFEEQEIDAAEMSARIADTQAAGLPWLVVAAEDQVEAYAYASRWKGRCAYRYAVESTIYLAPTAVGQGTGTRLYTELLRCLREQGLHTVIGGVALPNAASVALHEKLGYEKTAHFREVGFKFGRWIDVAYWQRQL